MDFLWSNFRLAMLLSGISCAVCGVYVLRRPGAVGRVALAAALFGAAVWGLAYGVELGSVGSERVLWGALKYVGIVLLPPAWLVFALQYTGHDRRVTRRLVAMLSIEPAVVLGVLAAPPLRDLVRSYPPGDPSAYVKVNLGPVFYALFLYSGVLAAFGTALLALTLGRVSTAYRRQSVLLFSAVGLVWTANVLATIGAGRFRILDPTPLGLAVGGLMLVFGVFRFDLLDLVPVARTRLVETMPDPVLVLDAHQRVIDHNPAADRILGAAGGPSLLGLRLHEVIGQDLPLTPDGRPTRHELTVPGAEKDSSFELVMSVLGEGRGDGPGHLVVLRDITARKEAERRLQRLAHFDSVTGLPNRALFHDRFEQALAQAVRREGSLALLFVDLDQFKLFNDSLGHDGGDAVLVAVACRLQDVLRAEDTVARLGGDEFGLLLPDVDTSPPGPLLVAQKVLQVLAGPLTIHDREVAVRASIGIAVFPGDGSDQDTLLKRADAAMYEAKALGGHQARFAGTV